MMEKKFNRVVISKNKNASLDTFFKKFEKKIPTGYQILNEKFDLEEIDKTFYLIEDYFCVKTPYLKHIKEDIIFSKIYFGKCRDKILTLKINFYNLTDWDEKLNFKFSEEELLRLQIYVVENLFKEFKLIKDLRDFYSYEFLLSGPNDENNFCYDIRDSRSVKYLTQKENRIFFFSKGEETNLGNKKIIFFSPNNISIYLSILKKSFIKSKELYKRIYNLRGENITEISLVEKDKNLLYSYFEEVIKSVIFSFIAIESFVNSSIPEDFIFERKNVKGVVEKYNKQAIEKWISTSDKLSIILPSLYQNKIISKEIFWSNFKNLERLRNDIVHQKTIQGLSIMDNKFYKELLNEKIFDFINSSVQVIEFYYKENTSHPYFPLGLGLADYIFEEFESKEKLFDSFKELTSKT